MEQGKYRIYSIDILRGIVMIIMALDHTRDFFHITAFTADPLDPATTTYPLFFTRWITHFCAPVFVFLSGVSAWLSSRKKSGKETSNFLIKRGLWLILAEILIVTLGITFNPMYNAIILQVIWAIGSSMVLLGLFLKISPVAVVVTGLILVFGHNILDYFQLPNKGVPGFLTALLFRAKGAFIPLSGSHALLIMYAMLPWTGVMFLGYSAGRWFAQEVTPEKRKKILLTAGAAMTLLYLLLRITGIYGDPVQWQTQPNALFSLLNTEKYPPSLQYLGMTLGPSLIALALLEKARGKWTEVVSVYGRVPFFYYVLHFYLIHLLTVIFFFASGYTVKDITAFPPFFFRPAEFGYSLPVVYMVWIFVVVILYLPCKWFDTYKKEHTKWWLRYI